ncbi:MAG: HK97 family phage prohead protease [Aeromicrobium sp.]|uniref:HK97 family phage prohead protease n=1 Tax=Aeromicrobium sp. TaxID=1871063 RepID=UPI002636D51C|nr:HK97 family phage prohead protease [Aeromicrobium sp.]MDF1705061.1 HK97 family phage prohead protease [Aeromicrobium sp.]
MTATTFDSPVSASFSVDRETRVIRGLAVPYGVEGRANGRRWQFGQGTLRWPEELTRVKLLVGHDFMRAVGVVFELEDTPLGLRFAARVASGAAGDEALAMAEEGVWDGVSIGLGDGGRFATRSGVNHAVVAPLIEISLTPMPSFTDARVQSVAASAAQEGNTMTQPDPASAPTVTPETPAFDATALTSAITDAVSAGFAAATVPPREVVNPTGETFEVDEQPLYRFDGLPGQRSLTDDMKDALGGDSTARQHLDQFFNEAFAVTTGNTATLNPTVNRPDLYVGQLQFNRPLWDMVTTGSINDRTPFTIPKFASATGLVNPHVEGVEPTPGTFAATSQTINPGAVSGKVEINREVLDQGGSPQADTIIWNEMLAGYYEAIELRIAAKLATIATAEFNFAGAVDSALVKSMKGYLASLQFVRGGNRFTGLALDGSLFPALINAADSTGRSLLPVHAPQNADGSTTGAFDRVSIGGLTGRAAWALGTGNAAKSYNFVPSSVYAWASAPRKFNFEYQVKSVDIAIWGYGAEAITRDSDVKPLDYTTADA